MPVSKSKKPKSKSGGFFNQKAIARELRQKDARRRVQQERTTKGRGKVAKVEIAKAKKRRSK